MNVLSRTRTLVQPLWSEGRGLVLLFVAFGWLLTLGTRYVFPALFPHLRTELGLDLTTLGALYTLLWATYAVGQFPAGFVSDVIGVRRTLTGSVLLSAVAVLVVALVTSFGFLVVALVLFGATSALYGPARFTIMSRIYPDYAGTAIGLTQASGQVGNMVLPAVSAIVATKFVWQAGFLYIIPLLLVSAVGIWFVTPKPEPADESDGESAADMPVRDIVAATFSPLALLLTAIMSLAVFIVQGLTAFYPTYLVEMKGLSTPAAATVFGLLFASATVVQPFAGSLQDRIGTKRALMAMAGVLVVSLPVITLTSTFPGVLLATLMLGGIFGTTPIALTHLTKSFPDEISGSGLGLVRTVYFLIASTGSFVVGAMADRGLFDESFFFLSALAVVILVATLFVDRVSE